jgi:hypothetical protein
MLNVDLLAVLIAIFLPWSTSAVVIITWLWALALMWTLDLRRFRRVVARPAAFTPIVLFLLACMGMLWSDVTWAEQLDAVGPTLKLLFLPLLLYHFSRSTRGSWVFIAFLGSSALLMLASWLVAYDPELTFKSYMEQGVVVKNHIDQSHVFALCAAGLMWPIAHHFRVGHAVAAGLLTSLAAGFVANMVFINVSRTVLIVLPVMLGAAVLQQLSWRAFVAALGLLAILGTVGMAASPTLRAKTVSLFPPYRLYEPANEPTSIEIRQEYWWKSVAFIREAPVIGHGTGSIRRLFERSASHQTGLAAKVTSNPHNQTLDVAIQWGAIAVIALYAMWLSHLGMFRGADLASWLGFLLVIQNMTSSLFNTHLFDFEEGWIYVLGVGVTGGMLFGKSRTNDEEVREGPANQQPGRTTSALGLRTYQSGVRRPPS